MAQREEAGFDSWLFIVPPEHTKSAFRVPKQEYSQNTSGCGTKTKKKTI